MEDNTFKEIMALMDAKEQLLKEREAQLEQQAAQPQDRRSHQQQMADIAREKRLIKKRF